MEDKKRHMNEEEDFAPEREATMEMTGLSNDEVVKLLLNFTHSEIRMGKWDATVGFIPGNMEDSLMRKKECKNIPVINENYV